MKNKGFTLTPKFGVTLRSKGGFTLIELLVVIGIIAILAGVVIVAINPARQFAQARDTDRWSAVNTILNAVGQRIADNKGIFETGCVAGVIPTTAKHIGSDALNYDLGPCIVPTYVSILPLDPSTGTAADSGYTIVKEASGRITVSAIGEITVSISVTR